jgi:hypothetical protein
MKSWNIFLIIWSLILAIALIANGKIEFQNLQDNLLSPEIILALLKTVLVAIAGTLFLFMIILLLLADVFLTLFMAGDFPIMQLLYHELYLGYFRNYYWDAYAGGHLMMSCIIIFGLSLIYSYLIPLTNRKTKFNFHVI